jgi:hypothetical protein
VSPPGGEGLGLDRQVHDVETITPEGNSSNLGDHQ